MRLNKLSTVTDKLPLSIRVVTQTAWNQEGFGYKICLYFGTLAYTL